MFIAILTLLSALSISGVAIFYSVIGLATIFPGAFVPVIIMGGVLEVGKLITASWLYRNWKFTPFMLRTYLTTAVIILSLITSMGIFGFLSKAHLEQNLASDTLIQRIQILNDKIDSEKNSILRQNAVIDRLEKSINRSTGTADGDIEVQQSIIADANEKLKTLLTVETNTVRALNDRLKVLDKNVSDILTSDKSFFNEEKAAADLKASQKAERELIAVNIKEAQDRIAELKTDHKAETAEAKTIIANMRSGSQNNKSTFTQDIETAENKIFDSQGKIDTFIIEKQPLEKEMLTLEAEIGPVKYIAALAVDWGWTEKVETSKAVRWVILMLIVVFDPLAVLLLIAANQSLMRRFPPEVPKPQEVIDLEKPDLDHPPLPAQQPIDDSTVTDREQNDKNLKNKVTEWQEKLDVFNTKVPKPNPKTVEIIQEDDSIVPHVGELKGQKKTEQEEIAVDKELQQITFDRYDIQNETKIIKAASNTNDGFDPDEHTYDTVEVNKPEPKDFPTISEQIEEVMEPERNRPNFTEVIEPVVSVKPVKETVGMLGTVLVKDKKPLLPPKPKTIAMTDEERTGMLNKFHQEHGKFKDISDVELKKEKDESNKAQFLKDVGITEDDARNHPAITESRMAFFEDHIDDISRGDTTAESLPEDLRKTLAVLISDYENPSIITKGSAMEKPGLPTMNSEQLKEHFTQDPEIDNRDITEEELDNLLEGFEEAKPKGKTRMIVKDGKRTFVPIEDKEEYVQNEEQNEKTLWNKTKELDLPEPEKNEILLPTLDAVPEAEIKLEADNIDIQNTLPISGIDNHKKRLLTDQQYREKIEQRINDLITKLERNEVKLSDLTEEDQKIIIALLKQ